MHLYDLNCFLDSGSQATWYPWAAYGLQERSSSKFQGLPARALTRDSHRKRMIHTLVLQESPETVSHLSGQSVFEHPLNNSVKFKLHMWVLKVFLKAEQCPHLLWPTSIFNIHCPPFRLCTCLEYSLLAVVIKVLTILLTNPLTFSVTRQPFIEFLWSSYAEGLS